MLLHPRWRWKEYRKYVIGANKIGIDRLDPHSSVQPSSDPLTSCKISLEGFTHTNITTLQFRKAAILPTASEAGHWHSPVTLLFETSKWKFRWNAFGMQSGRNGTAMRANDPRCSAPSNI